jgi:hypothetical protein
MIAAGERSVPKTGSARALLGIAAAIRATVPAPRFFHAYVAGLAVKFLQGVDHFIKLDDVTGTEDLPQSRHRFEASDAHDDRMARFSAVVRMASRTFVRKQNWPPRRR